jgi:hypothetical protein
MQLSLVHGRPGSAAAYTNLVRYRTTDGRADLEGPGPLPGRRLRGLAPLSYL